MTRADLATYLGARFGAYLEAASRGAGDASGSLGGVIDDALRALGVAYADLAAAEAGSDEAVDDWVTQASYYALLQVSRDLGATSFDVSTGGDSFRLSQLRAAVKEDLDAARRAVLDRFGAVGAAPSASGVFATLDLNYLTPDAEALV